MSSIFGTADTANQANSATSKPSIFGSFGSTTTNNQQQPSNSLFSSLGNQQQQPQQQPGGSIFGSKPQTQSIFGASQNQPKNPQQGGGLFGTSYQGQPQQQQQQQQGLLSPPQHSLGSQSLWQPNNANQRQKTVPEQMAQIYSKYDKNSPDCAFQHYFYNKVPDDQAVFFRPNDRENPVKWEDALSKKPGKGYVPVLCVGFDELNARIKLQSQMMNSLNLRLHEINNSLTEMLQVHDLQTVVRIKDVQRKHVLLSQRCLSLAAKVQVLRNRGYAMGSEEEDLKKRLVALEKSVFDPALNGREEEIWARMVTLRERARALGEEMDKGMAGVAGDQLEDLDDETMKRVEKALEDYATQLQHLQRELNNITSDFKAWESRSDPTKNGR